MFLTFVHSDIQFGYSYNENMNLKTWNRNRDKGYLWAITTDKNPSNITKWKTTGDSLLAIFASYP